MDANARSAQCRTIAGMYRGLSAPARPGRRFSARWCPGLRLVAAGVAETGASCARRIPKARPARRARRIAPYMRLSRARAKPTRRYRQRTTAPRRLDACPMYRCSFARRRRLPLPKGMESSNSATTCASSRAATSAFNRKAWRLDAAAKMAADRSEPKRRRKAGATRRANA
jgi:hypothetical protein